MRRLCASTLVMEFVVIGLAGLVAMRLTEASPGTVWAVSGAAMALCLVVCLGLGRPGAVALGWALQVAVIASGFVLPVMFVLGAAFAGLWWASIHFGRQIDQFARQAAAREAA